MRTLGLALLVLAFASPPVWAQSGQTRDTQRSQTADDYRALGAEIRTPGNLGKRAVQEIQLDNIRKDKEQQRQQQSQPEQGKQ